MDYLEYVDYLDDTYINENILVVPSQKRMDDIIIDCNRNPNNKIFEIEKKEKSIFYFICCWFILDYLI
jgi:hypothetical protein